MRFAEDEQRPELAGGDGLLLPDEDGRGLTVRFGDGRDVGPVTLRQRGLAAMINATAATTTARHLLGADFDPAVAAQALAAVSPPFGRGEVIDFALQLCDSRVASYRFPSAGWFDYALSSCLCTSLAAAGVRRKVTPDFEAATSLTSARSLGNLAIR